MLEFHVEQWRSFYADAKGLMQRHWEEIALDREHIKLSLDEARYQAMDDAGILHVLAMRSDGKLVGYYLAFLLPHVHYKDAGLMAFTDIYFVVPEARRVTGGIRLFIEAEASLRSKGVTKAYLSHKAHKDNGPIFKRLGWTMTDVNYCKMLNGGVRSA